MLYEQIELIIKQKYPQIWKQLLPLHCNYKNIITDKVKGNYEFLACYEENEQVAKEFVYWFNTIPKEIKNDFLLISLSYIEVKRRSSKRNNLTIKANSARRNFRRFCNLNYEEDIHQKQFDKDKQKAEKSYIIIPKNNMKDSLSAYDVKQFNLSRQIAINLSIAGYLECFCNTYLSFKGFFLTLTLPEEFHNCSYEKAREEIAKRWKRIKSSLKYKGILYLGIEVIELQKDETPHYHIQLWINPSYEKTLISLILKHFNNEANRMYSAKKDISDAIKIMKYCSKDTKKDNSKVYISFIGLKKDIRARYNSLFHNKKYKELSDYRTYKANKIIHQKSNNYLLLLLIRGFADDRLNSLSSRHPDTYYIANDKQKELMVDIVCLCNKDVKLFSNNKKENEYNSKFILNNIQFFMYDIHCLYSKYLIVYYIKYYLYYVFLLSLLYITKKVHSRLSFDYQCVKSKGQPPPYSYI